jgi:hypothetical protein
MHGSRVLSRCFSILHNHHFLEEIRLSVSDASDHQYMSRSSGLRFKTETIVDSVPERLLAAQVSFSRLNGRMTLISLLSAAAAASLTNGHPEFTITLSDTANTQASNPSARRQVRNNLRLERLGTT